MQEAARLIPNHTRNYIERVVFGPDSFMVRRDMLNDALGFRQASVDDLFTGKTRWGPKGAKEFELIAMGLFGNKAYPGMVAIERKVQEFVASAKRLIVVKSVIVPAANLIASMIKLLNRGVPPRHVLRGIGAKTDATNSLHKRRKREIDLDADLRAAQGKDDLIAIRKIEDELASLRASYRP